MQPFQYIVIFCGLFFMYVIKNFYIRDKIKKETYIFFMFVSFSLILIGIYPTLTSTISRLLGIGRGVDLLIYISLLIIFYLLIRIFVKQKDLEDQISKIVEELALERVKKK